MGCSIATVQHQPVSGLQEGASMLTTVACQLKLLTVAKLSMREICSTAYQALYHLLAGKSLQI